MYKIIEDVSAERIESDITNLVSFGTRHTLSDTISKTRGIGAARRWIKKEFEKISISPKATVFLLLGIGIVFIALLFYTLETLFVFGIIYLLSNK